MEARIGARVAKDRKAARARKAKAREVTKERHDRVAVLKGVAALAAPTNRRPSRDDVPEQHLNDRSVDCQPVLKRTGAGESRVGQLRNIEDSLIDRD